MRVDVGLGDDRRRSPAAGSGARALAVYGSFRYGQYFEDIFSGVTESAIVARIPVISIQTSAGVLASGDEVSAQAAISRVAWDHFDAAITMVQTLSPEYIRRLRHSGKFVIQIGQERRGANAAVRIDNVGGVRDAVSHLAEHGHTRIGFLSPGWQVDTAERYCAYRDRMRELDFVALPLLGQHLPRHLTLNLQGHQAAQQFLSNRQGRASRRCTALVIAPDMVALGFLRGVREAGVQVPEDLALISIDDIDQASISDPPLASVAISFKQLGRTAFSAALAHSSGEPLQQEYTVPERLVPRESCGCPSGIGAVTVSPGSSPTETLAAGLLDAAQQTQSEVPWKPGEITRLAQRVVDILERSAATQASDRDVSALAHDINQLCSIDRAVQSAIHAIRTLNRSLVESPIRAADSARICAISAATLDLCDAIRSGQLQRRMAEHVDLKQLQVSNYSISHSLLGHDRDELRSLTWLQDTPVHAGALGLWDPHGQADRLSIHGLYDRASPHGSEKGGPPPVAVAHSASGPTSPGRHAPGRASISLQSFPPQEILAVGSSGHGITVITQVRFESSDWGLLAVTGDRALQSSLVQETFHQWSVLMSSSLDQEKSNADLARQAEELASTYAAEAALLEEVRASEERYALAIEAARGAIWDWDVASGRVFYSNNWKALLGHRDNEIGPTPEEWLGRIHPDDEPEVRDHLGRTLNGAQTHFDIEHRLKTATGDYRWIACSARTVKGDSDRPVRLVGSATDVTARHLLQNQLVHGAQYDDLTGLARSSVLKARLNGEIEQTTSDANHVFALLYIDLNGFKAINDTFGHATGDSLLQAVSARLQETLRTDDLAARVGGDEFAVYLSSVPPEGLDHICARIHERITAPYEIRGQCMSVGAAIGAVVNDGKYATADALLHAADIAMYRAKHRAHGRNMTEPQPEGGPRMPPRTWHGSLGLGRFSRNG